MRNLALSNFGLFVTPERRLAFDLNDFDETHTGPWEWDVKRLAASVAVAGRERGVLGRRRLPRPPVARLEGQRRHRADEPRALGAYGRMCGWTLARTGDRIAIAGYLGSGTAFDEAIAAFAEAYADQNERDHRALADAVTAGRVIASSGL